MTDNSEAREAHAAITIRGIVEVEVQVLEGTSEFLLRGVVISGPQANATRRFRIQAIGELGKVSANRVHKGDSLVVLGSADWSYEIVQVEADFIGKDITSPLYTRSTAKPDADTHAHEEMAKIIRDLKVT